MKENGRERFCWESYIRGGCQWCWEKYAKKILRKSQKQGKCAMHFTQRLPGRELHWTLNGEADPDDFSSSTAVKAFDMEHFKIYLACEVLRMLKWFDVSQSSVWRSIPPTEKSAEVRVRVFSRDAAVSLLFVGYKKQVMWCPTALPRVTQVWTTSPKRQNVFSVFFLLLHTKWLLLVWNIPSSGPPEPMVLTPIEQNAGSTTFNMCLAIATCWHLLMWGFLGNATPLTKFQEAVHNSDRLKNDHFQYFLWTLPMHNKVTKRDFVWKTNS